MLSLIIYYNMKFYNRQEAEILLDWFTDSENKEKLLKYMLDTRSNYIYFRNKLLKEHNMDFKKFLSDYAFRSLEEWLYARHYKLPQIIKTFLLRVPMCPNIKRNQLGFLWNKWLNKSLFYFSDTYIKMRKPYTEVEEYDDNLIYFLEERVKEFIPKEFIKKQH